MLHLDPRQESWGPMQASTRNMGPASLLQRETRRVLGGWHPLFGKQPVFGGERLRQKDPELWTWASGGGCLWEEWWRLAMGRTLLPLCLPGSVWGILPPCPATASREDQFEGCGLAALSGQVLGWALGGNWTDTVCHHGATESQLCHQEQ